MANKLPCEAYQQAIDDALATGDTGAARTAIMTFKQAALNTLGLTTTKDQIKLCNLIISGCDRLLITLDKIVKE